MILYKYKKRKLYNYINTKVYQNMILNIIEYTTKSLPWLSGDEPVLGGAQHWIFLYYAGLN